MQHFMREYLNSNKKCTCRSTAMHEARPLSYNVNKCPCMNASIYVYMWG